MKSLLTPAVGCILLTPSITDANGHGVTGHRIVSVAHIFLIQCFVFKVTAKKCEPGEADYSEGEYEISVNQEKQDDLRSHKDSLANTDVPLNLNVSRILS